MKKNNIVISILVFICFALYVAIELKLPCKDAEKNCGANTKRLQAQNDSLRQNNLALDEKHHALELKADSIQEKLAKTKQTIVQLKNKQHEKITAIDSLSSNELFGFFAKFDTEGSGTK
ncbi:MAG: hypothetical protein EPN85_11965 [Bacteroidetes bacterium]|nr:MAG: hypothetical protein EPN85_11965 [Bacteroidota bacterium]